MSSHSHDDNEEAYYVTSDAKDDSLYDKLTENGSYQRPVLEDIVAYLVSLDGVEQRGAYVEKSGSRKSGKKIKKEKIAYFLVWVRDRSIYNYIKRKNKKQDSP